MSESLLSEPLVPNATRPTPATAFHISAINLFSCQEALGNPEEAFSYLVYCLYTLWQAAQDSDLETLQQMRIHLIWQRTVTLLYKTVKAAGEKVEMDF